MPKQLHAPLEGLGHGHHGPIGCRMRRGRVVALAGAPARPHGVRAPLVAGRACRVDAHDAVVQQVGDQE
ncbi:MAG: hypothetical protein ACKOTD_09640, partial [Phycisphaerales bacterium]